MSHSFTTIKTGKPFDCDKENVETIQGVRTLQLTAYRDQLSIKTIKMDLLSHIAIGKNKTNTYFFS